MRSGASIVLEVEGDPDVYWELKRRFDAGKLSTVEGYPVRGVLQKMNIGSRPHDLPMASARVPKLKEIEEALTVKREEAVHRFLASNEGLILESLGIPNRKALSLVLTKFRLGEQFVTDFVVVSCDTSHLRVVLVELEPVADKVVTGTGKPSDRLASAIKQVADWKSWVNKQESGFLDSIRRRASETAPEHLSYFLSPATLPSVVRYEFVILIGRSDIWSPRRTRDVNSIRNLYESIVTIRSYDHLLTYASDLREGLPIRSP